MNGFTYGLAGGLIGALLLDLMSEKSRDPAEVEQGKTGSPLPVRFNDGEEVVAVEVAPGNFQVVLSEQAVSN